LTAFFKSLRNVIPSASSFRIHEDCGKCQDRHRTVLVYSQAKQEGRAKKS